MRRASLSGNTSLCVVKLWRPAFPSWPIQHLQVAKISKFQCNLKTSNFTSFSCLCGKNEQNPHPRSLGFSFATRSTDTSVVLPKCGDIPWYCSVSGLILQRSLITWSTFSKAGHDGAVIDPQKFRRVYFSQPIITFDGKIETRKIYFHRSWNLKLETTNMSGRQLRVRKEKTKIVETVVQVHALQNGIENIKTTKGRSPPKTEVKKLNKEDFEANSWQYLLLERNDENDLDSYTVAELRHLLREMKKQPKGTKAALLEDVKSWLYDNGCQIPSALEEESHKDLKKSFPEHAAPEKVDIVSRTSMALYQRNETQNGKKGVAVSQRMEAENEKKRTGSGTSKPTKSKRKKDTREGEVAESVDIELQVEKSDKETLRKKSSKKVAKEAVLKMGTITDDNKEAWTVLVHKKPQPEWVAYNPLTMRPEPPVNEKKVMKLLSWNVNGLRALLKEKGVQHEQGSLIARLAAKEDFDVLCLQETKLQEKDIEQIRESLLASHEESLWSCSTSKLGYSGTAVISRIKPLTVNYGLGVPDHDNEGRCITCEFDAFYFVVSYVPNSGAKLERLGYRTQEWDPALSGYLKELEKKKPVILTGDLNCAHEEIDIHDPAGNKRSAGFTGEERESFKTNFLDQGFVDTFRKQHPNAVAYTYWGYRTACRPKNKGWRLDYFLVSESLTKNVHDSYTIPDVGGSDHCPVGLILRT